jgi:hypothetical protein
MPVSSDAVVMLGVMMLGVMMIAVLGPQWMAG